MPTSQVLRLHFGLTVDLFLKWRHQKAALGALNDAVQPDRVQKATAQRLQTLKKSKIPSGMLSLHKFDEYGALLVSYNAAIQWLLLHSTNGGCS